MYIKSLIYIQLRKDLSCFFSVKKMTIDIIDYVTGIGKQLT